MEDFVKRWNEAAIGVCIFRKSWRFLMWIREWLFHRIGSDIFHFCPVLKMWPLKDIRTLNKVVKVPVKIITIQQNVTHSNFVWPPLALITACIGRGIVSISFINVTTCISIRSRIYFLDTILNWWWKSQTAVQSLLWNIPKILTRVQVQASFELCVIGLKTPSFPAQ